MNLPGSRQVLVVAYIFPPLGGSGVYRTAKFAKYLPQFGWEPVVVCGSDPEPFATGVDESLLAELPPELAVMRVPHVSARGPRRLAKRLLARRAAGSVALSAGSAGHQQAGGASPEPVAGDKSRIVRAVNAVLAPVEFPPIDDGLYWALRIVPSCLRLIRQHGIKAIFTTSFPYSDHIAGLLLHRLTGLPWVADFRDPWSQNADVRMAGWRRWCDVTAERSVLRSADRVIGVTPTYTQDLQSLAPERAPQAFVTIENGYDEDDFAGMTGQANVLRNGRPTILAHVGTPHVGATLPFLRWLEECRDAMASLELRFVGGVTEQDSSWLATHPMPITVRTQPRCVHSDALSQMQAADALLLLLPDGADWYGNYPGKTFEYMRAGRPILLVGPDGDAARLLEASGTGCRLPLERPEEAAALLRLLASDPAGFRARHYRPDPGVISGYERRALTQKLAVLFDELAIQERRK